MADLAANNTLGNDARQQVLQTLPRYFTRNEISTRSGFSAFVCVNTCRPLSTLSQICARKYWSPYLLKTSRSPASESVELCVTGAFKITADLPSLFRRRNKFPDIRLMV